jgi:hypothetical protein
MDNLQKWHSMAEAYQNVYEASAKIKSAGKELDVSDGTDEPKPHPPHHPYPMTFYPALGRKVEVTKNTVNIDVTKDYVGPGGVEKAYYTYPASFDPTNREDVAKEQTHDGTTARYPSVQKEEALEVVGDYLMENGLVADAESVDAFFEHMSDNWKKAILEDYNKQKTELQIKASKGNRSAMDELKKMRAAGKIGKEPGFGPGTKKMGEEYVSEDAMGKTLAILKDKYGHDPEANRKRQEELKKNKGKGVKKTSIKTPTMSLDKAMGYGMGKYQGD